MKLILTAFLAMVCSVSISQVTFKVDDVEPAIKPIQTDTISKIAQELLERKIAFVDNSEYKDEIIYSYKNPLIGAIYYAYADHRPLVLTPDVIWYQISQNLALHLDKNIDKYGNKILKEGHDTELYVRNDAMLDLTSESWSQTVNELSRQIKSNCKTSAYNYFVEEYTTTVPSITTAYQLNLMYAFKKKISYAGGSGCGIPEITIKGTSEDWEKIYSKLEKLDHYGMKFWRVELEPIIKEFVNASKGEINKKFWQSIYKEKFAYGELFITGWSLKLFPFIQTQEMFYDKEKDDYFSKKVIKKNPFLTGEKHWMSNVSGHDFPKGLIKVDFKWDLLNDQGEVIKKHNMWLFGGFIGIHQNKENLALTPLISWGAAYKDSIKEITKINTPQTNFVFNNNQLWTPEIYESDSVDKPAIYDPLKFDNHKTSLEGIQILLSKNIDAQSLKKARIEFVLTVGNTIADIKVSNVSSEESIRKIKLIIKSTEKYWKIAQKEFHPGNLHMSFNNDKLKEKKELVNVNSKIVIEFD